MYLGAIVRMKTSVTLKLYFKCLFMDKCPKIMCSENNVRDTSLKVGGQIFGFQNDNYLFRHVLPVGEMPKVDAVRR